MERISNEAWESLFRDDVDSYNRPKRLMGKVKELLEIVDSLEAERQADKDKIAELEAELFISSNETADLILKMEELKANPCTGCTHEPKSGDPYPTPCGECSRWWSDNFEEKK